MANSILQSFLDNRFIKTDAPEHIENLKKASEAVQRLLKKKKPRIIGYTLVALDPTISDKDPVIEEVEGLIIKQWSTFRNSVVKTKDTPITYIQAVILDALNKLSKEEDLAAIIWLTGCNVISHYKLAGQEEVLTQFLLKIGKKVEEVARSRWNILENAQIDTIELVEPTLLKVMPGKVNEAGLQGHLLAAAVYSGWATNAGGGENPYTQGQNNFNWPKFFAERAAQGLSEEINTALSAQNKSLSSISKSIQESLVSYFSGLKPYLDQVSSSILQSSQSITNRSTLLWWKQSLYSQRLDLGYRALSLLAVMIAMATDLADSVSPIYPKSVNFFLEETLRDVLGEEIDKITALSELLKKLQRLSDPEKHLLDAFTYKDDNRKSLGSCIADVLKNQMTSDEFFEQTGIEKKTEISMRELTVWLFNDLQANALANKK